MASYNKMLLLKLIIANRINRRRKRQQRSIYIREIFRNRDNFGELHLIKELRSDPEYHHRYFRMDKENFDTIFNEVEHLISHERKHCRPISPLERLSITIRYLATGNSQISLGFNYRISRSSISKILRETMAAICEKFSSFISPPALDDWIRISAEFKNKWSFPNCCGAIDGKHIRIKAPTHSGSEFYNYKNFFSIVLLAVVDPHYCFSLVHIGESGSNSDGGILARSQIGKKLLNGQLDFPPPQLVDEEELPHVILGDDGFPLKANIMRPYAGKYLGQSERIFNYRLSRARMVSENAFGILAARWRILHSCINADLDLIRLIVKTTVILHNFLVSKNDSVITGDVLNEEVVVPGNWREILPSQNEIGLAQQGSNNYTVDAEAVREKFKKHFVEGSGKVNWQIKHVTRGTS